MPCDFDVLIAGGGPVGGSLALGLQHSGYRVAVVEALTPVQKRSSGGDARPIAVANGSAQILDCLGVWANIANRAVPIRKIHVSDRGHFGKTRLMAEKHGVSAFGFVVTSGELEERIDRAVTASIVEHIVPARVKGLEAGCDTVGVDLDQGGARRRVTARLVVGADGWNSTVRRLAGIDAYSRDYGQTAITTTVRPELDPVFTAYERFTETGPLALLPVENQCCAVIWTQTNAMAQSLMALSEREFSMRLLESFGQRLGALALCAPRLTFPLKLLRAGAMTATRVTLVGNAAHQLHPVAGQGLNLGLRDVACLVECLLAAKAQRQEDPGQARILRQYEQARRKDHETVIRFTDGLVRIFSNAWPPLAVVRNTGLIALDHWPWAKQVFSRYAMGISGGMPQLRRAGGGPCRAN